MRPLLAKTASVLTLGAALFCGFAHAAEPPAAGRPYTIEDLLHQSAFGSASIDPKDRWVVFEQAAPYAASPRFDYGVYLRAATNTLWIADSRSNGPAERLLPVSEGAGHVLGDWSPSGRKLLVFRLQRDQWRLGVVEMATRTVQWLDVHPGAGGFGRVVQWRSDDELLLIDRPDDELPYVIGWDAGGMALTRDRWAAQAGGVVPSHTLMGAGRFGDDIPVSPEVDLVRLDLRTGVKTVLSRGRFVDLELSPDHSRVAAMAQGGVPPVDQTRPLWPVDRPERRRVEIVDLETETVVRPCGGCAVAPYLMDWSADSSQLLVWMTGQKGPTSGDLAALQPEGGVQIIDRFGLEPDVSATRVASFTAVRALWQGARPVLRGRRNPSDRYDWYRLEPEGPVNLSAALAAAPVRIDAVDGEGLIGVADGAVWRLGRTEPRRLTPPGDLRPFAPFDILEAPRLRYNGVPSAAPSASVLVIGDTGRLEPAGRGWRPSTGPDGEALITPMTGSATLAVEAVEHNGVRSLVLRRPDGRTRSLSTLNAYLSDVRFAKPVAIAHFGPDGDALTSWLYLPTIPVSGPIPLVVLAYPGMASRPQRDPGEFVTELNLQQLTAAGYAVLTPSTPRRFFPDEPAKALADQLLAVVDAALAQHPELDPDRLSYWGHSFGGYSGLVVATQTDRFRSIIVQASSANLSEKWGEFSPWTRADARWGVSMRDEAGWVEASQGAMGGPPWSDPERYVRNSPLFQADCIQTPILIMKGERDAGLGQSESVFTALWRQNKDVRLITWWGEGHTIASPANLREMYRQILVWLAETAGPRELGSARPLCPFPEPALDQRRTRQRCGAAAPHEPVPVEQGLGAGDVDDIMLSKQASEKMLPEKGQACGGFSLERRGVVAL